MNEPEVVEMGNAAELVKVTFMENTRENPLQVEPTYRTEAVYEPEVVEMGNAAELVKITFAENAQENPPQVEPTYHKEAVYAPEGE